MNPTTERIRALNDELRRDLPNGHAVLTTGVVASRRPDRQDHRFLSSQAEGENREHLIEIKAGCAGAGIIRRLPCRGEIGEAQQ